MTTAVLRDRLAALLAPRYVLDRELASGGMAQVFLAHDPVLRREVAIKLLPPEQVTAVARERFLREARLLAELTHPHVVPILEVQEQAGLLWFVMPRMEGDTLAHRIREGALPIGDVRRIGSELLDALAFAHSHGVIHRDVKPGNIFLHGDHALLADFGVALLHDPNDDTLTEAGRLLGTLRYMTPEQLTGAGATTRSDLYALGATLYEAATGKQWNPALHPVAATWQGVPPAVAAVLRRALEPLPERRWPDAQSFRVALEESRWRRLPRRTVATGILTVLVVVAVLVFTRSSAAPTPSYDMRIRPFIGPDSSMAKDVKEWVEWAFNGYAGLRLVPSERAAEGKDSTRFAVDARLEPVSAGTITYYDIRVRDNRRSVSWKFRVPGDRGNLVAWGAAIADSLVGQLFPTLLTEFRQFSSCKGNDEQWNHQVWEDYWAGEAYFQEARWQEAEEKFQQAWILDTTFSTALWYQNLARQFRRVSSDAELAQLAGHSARLCSPLAELVQIQVEPDLDIRMRGFENLARAYPKYPPIRLLLANELFHRGPLTGRELREGLDTFWNSAQQLADLDQATNYMQVIWGAIRIGDETLARKALSRRGAVTHDHYSRFLRLATEGRFRPWLARPLLGVALWFADDSFVADASNFARIGLEFDIPREQLAVGRLLARRVHGASDGRRADGFAAEATALLLLGRPRDALRQLDSGAVVARSDSGYQLQRAEWRVLLPIAGMPIPEEEVNAGRRALASKPATDPLWPRATWALMVDANARHDVVVRDRLRAALRARAPSDSVARHLALFADAIALGDAGLVDSALAMSHAIHRETSDSMGAWRGPLTRAIIYLKRGEWQLARGDRSKADLEWLWHENNDLRGWPTGEPQEGELDAALSALVRLRRAGESLAPDKRRKTCAFLGRVAELWRGAEPTFDSLKGVVQQEIKSCHT